MAGGGAAGGGAASHGKSAATSVAAWLVVTLEASERARRPHVSACASCSPGSDRSMASLTSRIPTLGLRWPAASLTRCSSKPSSSLRTSKGLGGLPVGATSPNRRRKLHSACQTVQSVRTGAAEAAPPPPPALVPAPLVPPAGPGGGTPAAAPICRPTPASALQVPHVKGGGGAAAAVAAALMRFGEPGTGTASPSLVALSPALCAAEARLRGELRWSSASLAD